MLGTETKIGCISQGLALIIRWQRANEYAMKSILSVGDAKRSRDDARVEPADNGPFPSSKIGR